MSVGRWEEERKIPPDQYSSRIEKHRPFRPPEAPKQSLQLSIETTVPSIVQQVMSPEQA
jgi:hypothetical protein